MSILISQLSQSLTVASNDFFPLVESSSITTKRSYVSSISDWMELYGTASYAINVSTSRLAITSSNTLQSNTSSYSSLAFHVITASYFNINLITSIPFSLSSSWASSSVSSSHSETSSWSPSTPQTFVSYSLSSSWASSSISASHTILSTYTISASLADTASYILMPNHPGLIKASATLYGASFGSILYINAYNISDITFIGINSLPVVGTYQYNYGLTFSSPLPSKNYIVFGSAGTQPADYPPITQVNSHRVGPAAIMLKNSSSIYNTTTYCTFSIIISNGTRFDDIGGNVSIATPTYFGGFSGSIIVLGT